MKTTVMNRKLAKIRSTKSKNYGGSMINKSSKKLSNKRNPKKSTINKCAKYGRKMR